MNELTRIKRALLSEWTSVEKKHRDSGDDWYIGVLSGIEVALSQVDAMLEHENNHNSTHIE